jgi:hypothetical protein
VSNPLWSPQWEGMTSNSGGIPNEGGELYLIADEEGKTE